MNVDKLKVKCGTGFGLDSRVPKISKTKIKMTSLLHVSLSLLSLCRLDSLRHGTVRLILLRSSLLCYQVSNDHCTKTKTPNVAVSKFLYSCGFSVSHT